MCNGAKKFEEKRRWLKNYKVVYNLIGMSENKVKTTKTTAYLIAHSFIDCLAKTESLHRCNAKDILEISFQNLAMEITDE